VLCSHCYAAFFGADEALKGLYDRPCPCEVFGIIQHESFFTNQRSMKHQRVRGRRRIKHSLLDVPMTIVHRDNALVVKKKSASTFLLFIQKKRMLGTFFSVDVPDIGAVITVVWRNAEARDTIDISGWNIHADPMGGFIVYESDHIVKFTGMFYTTGCVIKSDVPLVNPAIFNNLIGLVDDKMKLLKEDYIGKLKATVTFSDDSDGFRWTLCSVDEYFKKRNDEIPDRKLPYKGVVGAIRQGKPNVVHYITSRYFPQDVRFYTNTNVSPELVDDLLGREVYFAATKDSKGERKSHVVGKVCPITKSDLHATKYGGFFKVDVVVEYIGCSDEHGNTIVWSDQLEFLVDSHRLFEGLAHGLYHIQAIRHYKELEFARWKVKKVGERFKTLDGEDVCVAHSTRTSQPSSRQPKNQKKRITNRIRDHSTVNGSNERSDATSQTRENFCDSGIADLLERTGISSSRVPLPPSCHQRDRLNPKGDLEKTLRTCLHRCLESDKVRASIKQADPVFFHSLVDALMRV
ncbi:hypothetical protein GCK32_011428, partial [Trichostrongylus colubriformis]